MREPQRVPSCCCAPRARFGCVYCIPFSAVPRAEPAGPLPLCRCDVPHEHGPASDKRPPEQGPLSDSCAWSGGCAGLPEPPLPPASRAASELAVHQIPHCPVHTRRIRTHLLKPQVLRLSSLIRSGSDASRPPCWGGSVALRGRADACAVQLWNRQAGVGSRTICVTANRGSSS